MKRTLKVIALILSVVTLLTAMCIPAFAAYNYSMSVTIYYKDEAGNSVASTFSTSINAADTNKPTWNSPTVSGYALKNDSDATVTYDMLDKYFPPSNYVRNGSATYTVVYQKLYKHTVRYVNGSTGASIGNCTTDGKAGQSYSITAPNITGMTPTKSTITGTIGNGDTSETVYYYPKVYTVTYDANGGSGAPGSQTKEHGQTLTLSSQTPTRYGYSFLGWSRSATSASASYAPGGSYTSNYNSTLYAVWDPNRFTVTLNANGGSFGGITTLTKFYGTSLTLPSEIPTRSGYVFLGWSANAMASSASYTAGSNFTLNGNYILYAIWEKIPETYTVYFNANGGTNAPGSVTKTENITLTLPSSIPVRTGYTFQGWATSPTSSTVSYQAGGSYNQNASITLYAVWSPKNYMLCYDANDGVGAPSAQSKTHDVALTLSAEIPYRDRYKFLGWSMSNTATEPTYYPGDLYDYEGNVTLYAVWEYINYDLSVSELTVTPDEVKQYETVHVRFRMDSWDQKNAYENIPVEVILNGSVVYSTAVDFAIYGVNYVDFDLNVGGLEGIQTMTAWVNRGDYLNETGTGNNAVTTTFQVNKVVELKTDYVAPNADYIEGNDVVTSFYVSNSSPSAIVPGDHVNFTFEVYTFDASGNEVVVHRDTWQNVVVPGNSTNLVYFKWTVPENSAGTLYWCRGSVNENQAIIEDDISNNRTEFNRYSVSYETSQTPNTRYDSQAPNRYNGNVSAPTVQTGKATWNMWEYVNGSFVLKTYGLQISAGSPTVRPCDACKSATCSGGRWTMKSGYGITMLYSPVTASIPGYAMPQGNAYTGVQNIYATLPEYGYCANDGEYRTLEYVNGGYRFAENRDADGNERLHFIPVYVQDGEYIVSVTVTQVWTPAGMITAVRNSTPITIDGTIYDDFYQG